MYELLVRRHFDASHVVEGHPGKCARLHGHRWVVEVLLQCPRLNAIQMGVDFGTVKQLLDEVLPDHRHLNDVLPPGFNATAERVAEWLYGHLAPRVAPLGATLRRVTVWETPDCAAAYVPDEEG